MDIWMDRQKDGWMETDRWADGVFLWVRDWKEIITSSVSLLTLWSSIHTHQTPDCPTLHLARLEELHPSPRVLFHAEQPFASLAMFFSR